METSIGTPSRALIAGCGDIGLRVARRLAGSGGEVTAILRDPQKAAALESAGARVRIDDLDTPRDAGDWPWLFWFAPPPATGVADTRLRAWLAAQRGRIGRLIYVSTSGVYGDCGGRWIDEDEPLKPQTDRARRRADAEAALTQWSATTGSAVVVLRVPGIYGPGRLPVERLRQGLPVLCDAEAPYSNRIHADDLAEAAVRAAARGRAGAAYNLSDGQPTTMADYFRRCAQLLGLPPPPTVHLDEARRRFTPAMWSFVEESKRLRIDRARRELGYAPRHPDLERGLPSCLPR
ncbi:NAD-dependent epimerase/dehydratase family protein [Fontimonas sp. SYSU GA230001]|uniref:NAD-dependent epimerase/dehydratase family protein n=1 Tax=Fontimonas sp. SYSU GA230001 TaxID=3142450 RepID=UPI0032B3C059